ncbi:Mobile element protein [Richelia intracellularis]|nr:Mobile element protein [Richelia intracellularis]
MVLSDVSSTYLEGKAFPLAKYGYNREKKRGKLQIVFGLL